MRVIAALLAWLVFWPVFVLGFLWDQMTGFWWFGEKVSSGMEEWIAEHGEKAEPTAPAEEFGVPRARVAEMLGGANEILERPIHWRKLGTTNDGRDHASE